MKRIAGKKYIVSVNEISSIEAIYAFLWQIVQANRERSYAEVYSSKCLMLKKGGEVQNLFFISLKKKSISSLLRYKTSLSSEKFTSNKINVSKNLNCCLCFILIAVKPIHNFVL